LQVYAPRDTPGVLGDYDDVGFSAVERVPQPPLEDRVGSLARNDRVGVKAV
jgi:hypothetical protein